VILAVKVVPAKLVSKYRHNIPSGSVGYVLFFIKIKGFLLDILDKRFIDIFSQFDICVFLEYCNWHDWRCVFLYFPFLFNKIDIANIFLNFLNKILNFKKIIIIKKEKKYSSGIVFDFAGSMRSTLRLFNVLFLTWNW